MKRFLGLLFLLSGTLCVLVYIESQEATLFVSLESKTLEGMPVFNRVKLLAGWQQDTWLMQQSHQGLALKTVAWDRLAIVVNKRVTPYEASFYQFKPGSLSFGPPSEATTLRAPCFACHVSGPRAIRPQLNAADVQKTWRSQLQIFLLNLRIKSYGSAVSKLGQRQIGEVPFQLHSPELKQELGLKSCQSCHHEGGIRQKLEVSHGSTAQFLVKNGLMPPWPFAISAQDRRRLESF